ANRADGEQILGVLLHVINDTLRGEVSLAAGHLEALERPSAASISSRSVSQTTQLQVFKRDGFTCRYCSKRVLFVPVLRVLSILYPRALPYHTNWRWTECHPVYWTHAASCDHILPVARGGSSRLENLATACYMCNSIK